MIRIKTTQSEGQVDTEEPRAAHGHSAGPWRGSWTALRSGVHGEWRPAIPRSAPNLSNVTREISLPFQPRKTWPPQPRLQKGRDSAFVIPLIGFPLCGWRLHFAHFSFIDL